MERISIDNNIKCIIGRNRQAVISLFRTGVGAPKAAEVCHAALEGKRWDLIISTGYAAALIPSRIGAMIVADQVLHHPSDLQFSHPSNPLLCHHEFTQKAFNVGLSIDDQTRLGHIVTVPRIVNRAVDKQKIARGTGAIGLDMESATIGEIAVGRKIPFVAIRAISDLMDEDLPEEFNLFLSSFGWVKGLPSFIASPRNWAHLIRLQTQMMRSSRQMTRFFKVFLRNGNLWNREPGIKSAIG